MCAPFRGGAQLSLWRRAPSCLVPGRKKANLAFILFYAVSYRTPIHTDVSRRIPMYHIGNRYKQTVLARTPYTPYTSYPFGGSPGLVSDRHLLLFLIFFLINSLRSKHTPGLTMVHDGKRTTGGRRADTEYTKYTKYGLVRSVYIGICRCVLVHVEKHRFVSVLCRVGSKPGIEARARKGKNLYE